MCVNNDAEITEEDSPMECKTSENETFPTLSAVYQHITYHIETKVRFDFQFTPTLSNVIRLIINMSLLY